MIKGYIKLLYDSVKYRCNRRIMSRMHKVFSGYMIGHIRYLINNIEYSNNVPNSVDGEGNVNGTMTKDEWVKILRNIEYSLNYDINNTEYNSNNLPNNNNEVIEFLNKQEQDEKKYKQGLILLGRYYGDIWG